MQDKLKFCINNMSPSAINITLFHQLHICFLFVNSSSIYPLSFLIIISQLVNELFYVLNRIPGLCRWWFYCISCKLSFISCWGIIIVLFRYNCDQLTCKPNHLPVWVIPLIITQWVTYLWILPYKGGGVTWSSSVKIWLVERTDMETWIS